MDSKQQETLLMRITSNPGIFGGQPIIRGMRFRVLDVLEYLAAGMSPEDILKEFPYLTKEDITASLLYAAKKINHPVVSVVLDAA